MTWVRRKKRFVHIAIGVYGLILMLIVIFLCPGLWLFSNTDALGWYCEGPCIQGNHCGSPGGNVSCKWDGSGCSGECKFGCDGDSHDSYCGGYYGGGCISQMVHCSQIYNWNCMPGSTGCHCTQGELTGQWCVRQTCGY